MSSSGSSLLPVKGSVGMRKGCAKIRDAMLWIAVLAIPLQGAFASTCDSKQGCCSGNITCCCNNVKASCCDSSQGCQCGNQCHCCDQQREIPAVPFSESRIVQTDLTELACSSSVLDSNTIRNETTQQVSLSLGGVSSPLAVCIAFNCFRL